MRTLLTVFAILIAVDAHADDAPFKDWIFPGAKPREQSVNPITVTSADKQHVQTVANGSGQYLTDKPFHEVVLFYVRKSGIKKPNQIYAREFPGTDIHIPAHNHIFNFYRKEPTVTILHYIRDDVATAHLMITDHPKLGIISVSVTRSRNDPQTVVQLINHTSQRIESAHLTKP